MRLPWFTAVLLLPLWPACGGAQTDAVVLYQRVRDRISGLKDYSLQFEVNGPRGAFTFDYRCVRPSDIYTHVVSGAHQGVTTVYHGGSEPSRVRCHLGILTLWKSVDDPGLKDSPVTGSVWDATLKHIGLATPTLKGTETIGGHKCNVLTFSTGQLWIDAQTLDILKSIETEDGGPVTRLFYNIQINTSPRIAL